MTPYRKKPVHVHALRITDEVALAVLREEMSLPAGCGVASASWHSERGEVYSARIGMDTSNGNRAYAGIGDWILVDSVGKPYPCTDEVFQQTYEPI